MNRKRWIIISILLLIFFSNCFAGCINEEKNDEVKKKGENIEDTNLPPIIKEIKKIVGLSNEEVSFNITASDPDGRIILYEWDFDSDGIFDWNSSENGNTSHIYRTSGTFFSNFSVTDNEGKSNYTLVIVIINEKMLLPDPELYITFPSNNQTVNGTINITGTAHIPHYTDEIVDPVIEIEIKNESYKIELHPDIYTNDTYNFIWYDNLDTIYIANGMYKLKVILFEGPIIIKEIQFEIKN